MNEGKWGRAKAKERYASGGKAHKDEAQDKKLIKKMIGEKKAGKFARGGKAKGNTNINIVIAPQDKAPDMPPPMPLPMAPPPMAGPPGGPPMKPPMAPPPSGMMGMKRGGKITAGAESGVGRLQKAGFDYKSVRRG